MQVFPTTHAVEVFANQDGSLTIKQENYQGEDDDLIIVPVLHVDAVIRALRVAKAEAQK